MIPSAEHIVKIYERAIKSKKERHCTFEMSFAEDDDEQDEKDLFWFMNKVVPHAKKNSNKKGDLPSYNAQVTPSDEAFACMMLDSTRDRMDQSSAEKKKTRAPMSAEAKNKSQKRYSEVLKKFTYLRKEYSDNYDTIKDWMRSNMMQEGGLKQTDDEESKYDKFGLDEELMDLEENPHVMVEL